MSLQEVFIAEVHEDDGCWVALAGERVLAQRGTRWEAICYCDGYNQALHDFLLPPSVYDEVEAEDEEEPPDL